MNAVIEDIVRAATLAPSVDNCQPWRFKVVGDSLELYHDSERAEFFGNALNTASYVTFGAVVENVVIAAARHGLEADVDYLPDPGSGLFVRFTWIRATGSSPDLYDAIPVRCTNRRPYRSGPLPPPVKDSLVQAATIFPGVQCRILDNPQSKLVLARLFRAIDRVIFEHPLLHEGLFRWIRWTEDEVNRCRDGMPLRSLELNPFEQRAMRFVSSWQRLSFLNKFGLSRALGDYSYKLGRRSGGLGLIFTDGKGPEDLFRGGRAFERLWLTAAAEGVSLHPMGAIVFLVTRYLLLNGEGFDPRHVSVIQDTYERLKLLFPVTGDNALIMMFRVGYAGEPTGRSVRRPLGEVMD